MGERRRCRPRSLAFLATLVPAVVHGEANARQLWGSFTAEASNPVFSNTLSEPGGATAQSGMSLPFSPMTGPMLAAEREKLAKKGKESTEIASGIVEAFLHKQQLDPGELQCLVEGSGQVAGDLGVTAAHTVNLLEQMFGLKKKPTEEESDDESEESEGDGADDIAAQIDAMMTRSAAKAQQAKQAPQAQQTQQAQQAQQAQQTQAQPASPQKAASSLSFFYGSRRLFGLQLDNPAVAMGAGAMMLELAFSGQQMIHLTRDIVQRCVHGDALEAFKTAADHMRNLQYLEGHFLANGADIVVELADAVMDFSAKRYRNFGQDMGKAMRKTLLSKGGDARLPEGLPDKIAMANISAGLMQGFFGPGFSMDITTPDSKEPIHIDMHQCVSKNLRFFQSIWASTLLLVARKEAESGKGADTFGKKEEAVEFSTMLAFTMMQLPAALKRCNLGQEEEQMLMDAIKAMGAGTSIHIQTPQMKVSKQEVANNMAQTVKDWSHTEYYTFGKDLGLLMQKLTATMFPKLYIVEGGRLRRQLMNASSMTQTSTGGSSLPVSVGLLAAVALLLIAVVVLKSRRTVAAWQRQWCNQNHHADDGARESYDIEVSRSAYSPTEAVE